MVMVMFCYDDGDVLIWCGDGEIVVMVMLWCVDSDVVLW